jgi:U3 small nucleolar RNA-associated protein 20
MFVLANDDNEKCRMAAGEVLKEIFKRADKERMVTFLTLLRSWASQSSNPSVVRLAFQSYGFYFESQNSDEADVPMLLDSILYTLKTADEEVSDWEQIFAALQLTSVLVQKFPELLLSSSANTLWITIWECLAYHHIWVKGSAAKLVGGYLGSFASDNPAMSLHSLPLKNSGGLKFKSDDVTTLTKRFANMLKTPNLTIDLAEEIVKNLAFLGAIAGSSRLGLKSSLDDEDPLDSDGADHSTVGETAEDTVLGYLFRMISFILRKETSPPRAAGLVPKTAALALLERLVTKLSSGNIVPCLESILLPLHNLTDPSIPTPYSIDELFRSGYETLKSDAGALLETLKRKVGTKEFTDAIVKVREGVKGRRQARTGKRRVEAIAQPEKYGNHKKRKGERKKERRKEKGQEHGRRRNEY